MHCAPYWCSCTESYVDKGLVPEGHEDDKGDVIHTVWEHPSPLTQRTMHTDKDKRSICAASTRRSSESLTLSALFGSDWPKPEIDSGNEEAVLQENWLGTARKRGSQEHLGVLSTGLCGWMRRKVAGSRCRYVSNGFDLDLAYVTSRIITMGFPGRGSGACFRNPRKEVRRFLRWAHGDGCFRIYNLCVERSFRENGFEETVCFPCPDHCPPDFAKILAFCQDVEAWLKADESNVAVIHCKAGKGRSGTMISSLLVYAGAVLSARDALFWFGHIRGGTRAGVTIPSQIRWIAMFELWLKGNFPLLSDPMAGGSLQYRPCMVRLMRLGQDNEETTVKVVLMQRHSEGLRVRHSFRQRLTLESGMGEVHFEGPLWTEPEGLICLTLWRGCWQKLRIKAWWHHAFLQRTDETRNLLVLDLPKACVDGLQRDAAEHALTPADFRWTVGFAEIETSEGKETKEITET